MNLPRKQAMKMFEVIVEKEGLEFICWREVPTTPGILGKKAIDVMPCIMQAFIKKTREQLSLDWTLTENSTLSEEYLRRVMMTRMFHRFQARQ